MIIAILDMTLRRGEEDDTLRALRTFCDAARALPGCGGGGVYREVGHPDATLYVEIWDGLGELEAHVRSREYASLLAIMETSAAEPVLSFRSVAETRGLEWVKQVRLGSHTSSSVKKENRQ